MWLRHIHHPRDYLSISEKDGVWDSSYVSTGVYDENVNKTLGESKRAGDSDNSSDLGNGEVSYGYAVKGVEFTYLRVGTLFSTPGPPTMELPITILKFCMASTRLLVQTC